MLCRERLPSHVGGRVARQEELMSLGCKYLFLFKTVCGAGTALRPFPWLMTSALRLLFLWSGNFLVHVQMGSNVHLPNSDTQGYKPVCACAHSQVPRIPARVCAMMDTILTYKTDYVILLFKFSP